MITVIDNGNLFNTGTLDFDGESSLIIEDGIIRSIGETTQQADLRIDAKGQFVLPGFIDAHVHFRLATMDFRRLANWTEVEFGLQMARLSRQTLERGFTTVRDLGGEIRGLMNAIRAGLAQGPRIVSAGRMISQTGGHGDAEGGPREVPDCACQMRHTAFGIVADGADAVRKAALHNLRDGSDFIKIHVSGGVATPSDPLESTQYTAEEVQAAVVEAKHRQTYVAAHAYTPEAVLLAVENGVHSIEHGNLIDKAAATMMAASGSILVPTLSTYEAMAELGAALNLPQANQDKNKTVYERGLASLELAREAGVTLGFGTDLIGETQVRQGREFAIRAEVEPARDILRSMYLINPRLCMMEGEIGGLAPGSAGDMVLCKINPLENIALLANPADSLTLVLQSGMPVSGDSAL